VSCGRSFGVFNHTPFTERDEMPANIYIVDDDESVCRALKTLLMTYDFEAKIFNSAKNFFENVDPDKPGCVLLDIHMPGLDGWETQKKILASGAKLSVIFISAEKKDDALGRALNVGAVGFLQKPVHGQTLVDMINVASENYQTANNEK
jgi:FixJ family two-component response regulator